LCDRPVLRGWRRRPQTAGLSAVGRHDHFLSRDLPRLLCLSSCAPASPTSLRPLAQGFERSLCLVRPRPRRDRRHEATLAHRDLFGRLRHPAKQISHIARVADREMIPDITDRGEAATSRWRYRCDVGRGSIHGPDDTS
jgi:hypothetical protein